MSLKRNTAINLLGSILPTAVSLITVPIYLRQIGEIRFGVLAIVWLMLGYFGIFDLGVSRATTNQIARLRGASARDREQVFWTAAAVNTLFGFAGGVLLYALGATLVAYAFKMPEAMRPEVLRCLPWLALAVPLATISGVFAGVLEACERFATVNAIEVVGSILFRVIPLSVTLLHGPELRWLIISGLIAQALSVVPMFVSAARALPLTGAGGPTRAWVKPLFSYGGWVTINNVLYPLFASLDRLLIGAGIDAAAVTVYTVPYNLVHRFQILPAALARTLFPRLSGVIESEAKHLANRCISTLAVITLPMLVAATVLLHPFLSVWISPQFAERASAAGELLILGVWVSSLAFVPYALLQGQGRPRIVALIHLMEAPFFAAAIWFGVRVGGVIGAAVVMSVRDVIDALIFMHFGGVLSAVAGRLSTAAAWLLAAVVWVRLSGPPSATTVALGMILVLGSTIWAFRVEPLLSDLFFRARTRMFHTLLPHSEGDHA